jgi:hypothetical protein
MWPILGFQICFCIGNNMSRFLGSVDPGGGGSTKLSARELYDAGVQHGWSERERERENNRVVLTCNEGRQCTSSGAACRRGGGEIGRFWVWWGMAEESVQCRWW